MAKDDSASYVEDKTLTNRQLKIHLKDHHGAVFKDHLTPKGGIEGVLVRGAPGVGKSQMVEQLGRDYAEMIGAKFIKYDVHLFDKMETDIPKPLSKLRPGEMEEWFRNHGDHPTKIRKTLGDLNDDELAKWKKDYGEYDNTGFGKPVSKLNDLEFEQFVAANEDMAAGKMRKVASELNEDERAMFLKKEGNAIKTEYNFSLSALDPKRRREYLKENRYLIVGSLPVQKMYGSSMQGIPTINVSENGERNMDFAVPDFFKTIEEFPYAIVHLDEIYQIIGAEALLSLATEGMYQQTKLPERCLLLATGNLGKADFTTRGDNFGQAFNSRFTHYEMKANIKEWIEDFAIPNKIHPAIRLFALTNRQVFEEIQTAHLQAMQSKDPNMVISPNVRSLVTLSQNLYHAQEQFFGGQVDERKLTLDRLSESERIRFQEGFIREVQGKLGMDRLGPEFWTLYETAMTTVIPEVFRTLAAKKDDPVSEEFISKLNGSSRAPNAESIALTYTDYLPRIAVDIYCNLAKASKSDQDLREKRATLIGNMLQGLIPCHSDMRSLALSTFAMYVDSRKKSDPSVTLALQDVVDELTHQQNTNPEFRRMMADFKEGFQLGNAFG